MIVTLIGTIAEKYTDMVVLDVNGVGYGLYVTAEDHGNLSVGKQTKLNVYEHIRENSHDLFGFLGLETKRLFEQLIDVKGVGPKVAISLLGVGSASMVRQAIASGDTRLIQAAPGVGKRVAERIIVELKDKVGLGDILSGDSLLSSSTGRAQDEAVEALVSLGYSAQAAVNALREIDPKLAAEERVRQALKSRN